MTLATITERIAAKAEALKATQEKEIVFTLCGTKCRIHKSGTSETLLYSHKYLLGPGYLPMTCAELAEHVKRFQY